MCQYIRWLTDEYTELTEERKVFCTGALNLPVYPTVTPFELCRVHRNAPSPPQPSVPLLPSSPPPPSDVLILLVRRLGFGVTRSGTCRCDAGGLRLLSGAMLEVCG
jgi:hypothetical protein